MKIPHPSYFAALFCLQTHLTVAAPDYSLTVSGGTAGAHVEPTMFGTNVVYDKIPQGSWSTFLTTFNALGMKSLRYPGGTTAEANFDFRNSNVSGTKTDCITLTQYLQAVNSNGLTPILVVPTKRYENNFSTIGSIDAKDFVRAVNIDHGIQGGEQFQTSQTVMLWEIGNEYYADPNNPLVEALTPSLYGQIANAFSTSMRTIDNSIFPVVQFKRGDTAAATTIDSYLDPGVMERCVTHLYPPSSTSSATVTSQIEDGATVYDLPPIITEWNVSNDTITGLTLGNYLPTLFQSQVDAGVEISTQWPLMWQGNTVPTALASIDGTLRPQGQVYQWLNLAADGRNSVPSSSSSTAIKSLAWKDTSGHLSILVLCGSSQQDSQTAITLNGYNGSNFVVTSAFRLSASAGFGQELSNNPGTIRGVNPAKNGQVLTITTNKFSKQEVILINITRL